MSYRLHVRKPFDEEMRRIAAEQIEKAVAELGEDAEDRHEAIHDARKRFKKLRGLIRLGRSGHEAFYRRENVRFRDTARRLSAVRDRTALIEALAGLEKRFENEIATEAFAPVRAALEAKRQEAVEQEGDLHSTLHETVAALQEAETGFADFKIHASKAKQRALALEGLEENYRRARSALRAARHSRSVLAFHDLRKRIKYHAMHLKLIEPLWVPVMTAIQAEADRIGDDLGRDHDYAVLRAEMADDPETFGPKADRDVVLALMDRHQSELRETSLVAAGRILTEKPRALRARLAKLYRVAAEETPPEASTETPTGERRRAPLSA